MNDPPLLEEAVHFYRQGMHAQTTRSPSGRLTRRYLREAKAVREELSNQALAATVARGKGLASFDIPLETFPADSDCWRRPGWRGMLSGTTPFYCRPLGFEGLVMFFKDTSLPSPWARVGTKDERGRLVSGFMFAIGGDEQPHVDQMSLAVFLGGDDEQEARHRLAQAAPELYEWGERVARWADVVTDKLPKVGALHVTKHLYGDLRTPVGRRRLELNADEFGAIREFEIKPGHPIARYELSYVLNSLATHRVPLAIEMLKLAQHSLFSNKLREAVVEAGTAAEAAFAVLYDAGQTEEPRDPRWTLGTLVTQLAQRPGALPAGDSQAVLERELVRPRNDAVHRGTVTQVGATIAVKAAERVVSHVFELEPHDVALLDRRMKELAPILDRRP